MNPIFALFAVVLAVLTIANGLECTGALGPGDVPSGVVTSDLLIDGANCVVSDLNITGNVQVMGGGSLTTAGDVFIFGSVHAKNATAVTLNGNVKVFGNIEYMSEGDLMVGSDAMVGQIKIMGAADVDVRGQVESIFSAMAANLMLNGANVTNGGVTLEGGNTTTTICGSTLSDGVISNMVFGDLMIAEDAGCASNTIGGAVNVEKGSGTVYLIGNDLPSGDLIIVEQTGNVMIKRVTLSDITVQSVTGELMIEDFMTDSDGAITLDSGSVMIKRANFTGDVSIQAGNGPVMYTGGSIAGDIKVDGVMGSVVLSAVSLEGDTAITGTNGSVTVSDSMFKKENVVVTKTQGSVIFANNSELSVELSDNGPVQFNNNDVIDASITKNIGGVTIENNTFQILSCADNDPAPTGSGNVVNELADGQCAGFGA